MMKPIKTPAREGYEAPYCTQTELSPLDEFLDSYTIPEIVEEDEGWD